MDFKVPSVLPQDLQIIQDIVGEIPPPTPPPLASKSASPVPLVPREEDSIESSDEGGNDSEREVEADILADLNDEEDEGSPHLKTEPSATVSDSDSDSSSSSSDDEDEGVKRFPVSAKEDLAGDDDEDGPTGAVGPDSAATKNEVTEVKINVPDISEVGPNEVLERVGEIMSIMDKVVIIKGSSSGMQNRASERALDSDTLLVFEDRKVLGYIWETFGPTSQPFYRVQFNDSYPLDPEKVQLSREVFHVPARSHFVFLSQLKLLKGSDASNAHDEEPGDEELEFSDDEAEREYKRNRKGHGGSEVSSRYSTPAPARKRDPELTEEMYGSSPYDHPFNDMDFGAGPSRPPPMPYDDPYSDTYGLPESKPTSQSPPDSPGRRQNERPVSQHGRGRGGGRDGGPRERGRGTPYERRGRGDRGRGRGRGRGTRPNRTHQTTSSPVDEYDPRITRPMSPTSAAIARATGQLSDRSTYGNTPQNSGQGGDAYWPNSQQQQQTLPAQQPPPQQQQYAGQYGFDGYDYGYQPQFVQPHINPRFASAFAMSMGYPSQSQYFGYGQYPAAYPQAQAEGDGGWSAGWTGSDGQSGRGAGTEHQPPA